jgi:hypothetical protein
MTPATAQAPLKVTPKTAANAVQHVLDMGFPDAQDRLDTLVAAGRVKIVKQKNVVCSNGNGKTGN